MKVIIAPHPDDEIIGCFEVLKTVECIVYDGSTPQERRQEAERMLEIIGEVEKELLK